MRGIVGEIWKSSLNAKRVAREVFGPDNIIYLANGNIAVDDRFGSTRRILIGDDEVLWTLERDLCYGPVGLVNLVDDNSGRRFLEARMRRVLTNYNRSTKSAYMSESKRIRRLQQSGLVFYCGDAREVSNGEIEARDAGSTRELVSWLENGDYLFWEGISSPYKYDLGRLDRSEISFLDRQVVDDFPFLEGEEPIGLTLVELPETDPYLSWHCPDYGAEGPRKAFPIMQIDRDFLRRILPMHNVLKNIRFVHLISRLYGSQNIRPQVIGRGYHFLPPLPCHSHSGADTLEHSFLIYGEGGAFDNGECKALPSEECLGFNCFGCGNSHGLPTGFLAESLGYDARLLRGFLKPYYELNVGGFSDLPDKIEDFDDLEVFTLLVGEDHYRYDIG